MPGLALRAVSPSSSFSAPSSCVEASRPPGSNSSTLEGTKVKPPCSGLQMQGKLGNRAKVRVAEKRADEMKTRSCQDRCSSEQSKS
jgi:hypothetical protein